jgi:hypothetical protein
LRELLNTQLQQIGQLTISGLEQEETEEGEN